MSGKKLTINVKYINENEVFVLEKDGSVIGFYSIVELKKDIEVSGIVVKKGYGLDHMLLLPEFIGKGLGKKIFNHLLKKCKAEEIKKCVF